VLGFAMAESGRLYEPHDLAIAEDLASRAAIAIENARLYAELKAADQSKNEFLATLAHELRNPLASIRNVLHLMRDPTGNRVVNELERAMAERQVVHLTRLIDDLMDVARITRGKIELHKTIVELKTIVSNAIETSRPQIDDRRHNLNVVLPSADIPVEGDPTRLEQVFWNLLNNAAKYSDPGSRIDLVLEREGKDALIRVRDTGMGIQPEMLPKVFGMFVQVSDHKDHALGGLGIGLSLVRNLVEMHGGSISARSDGPGTGSEFTVRLPVVTVALKVDSPSSAKLAATPLPRRLRTLVVDDNLDAAQSLARVLQRLYSHEVRIANDGPEAIALAQEFRPEVILLDIGLPGMSGYEVAERLRSQQEQAETFILALTGWGQEEDRRRSESAGIDHHLVKPVDPNVLIKLLAERFS
jgi:CheY-like chemotaxis protein